MKMVNEEVRINSLITFPKLSISYSPNIATTTKI